MESNKKQVLLVLTILVSLFSYSAFAGRGMIKHIIRRCW
ncbi:hypothetical protein PanWU01x14_203070 [Parasponia andersonii]|uniref:Uncharacterized protein n=1 Tax=Parasponia andersonii TaxID=3476 RepID=A0A2P5BWZ0_PARAD|nr:hypothetical protein PanWU01x14_203070 [Parasponia andersonii]